METWILRRKCQRQNALLSCYWLDSSMWLSQRALWIQESGFVYRRFQYSIFANSSELSKPICLKSGKYSHVYDSSVFFFGMTRVRWTVQFGNKERGQLLQFLCNGAIAWSLESVLFSILICVMSLSASAGNLDRVHLMHDDCKLFVSCETFPSLDSSRTSKTQGKRKHHRYKGKIRAKLRVVLGYTSCL